MTQAPRKACVIGDPIAHSRSPLIHGYWLRTYGIAGTYERVRVAPEELEGFLKGLSGAGYAGCNITIPHKERAFALLDAPDSTAAAVGAVNTVWCDGDRLQGTNTDVYGFIANLDAAVPGWDAGRGHAVILGAGGAARGVAFGLKERGFGRVTVVNRTQSRGEELARALGSPVSARSWSDLPGLLAEADLVANATSLGMVGKDPLVVPLDNLRRAAVVADLVYTPLETRLLAAARARGNRVADGLGMLLHQAVLGFERWFGVRPEVTQELRDIIVADLVGPPR
jgi:shikimate dehydrogenase